MSVIKSQLGPQHTGSAANLVDVFSHLVVADDGINAACLDNSTVHAKERIDC